VAGLATFIVFGAAALAQVVLARARLRNQLGVGFVVLIAGLVVLTVGAWLPNLAVFLARRRAGRRRRRGGVQGQRDDGAGPRAAADAGRGAGGLFLASYVGLSVPVLALGLATQFVSAQVTLVWFAAVLVVVLVIVARRLADRGRTRRSRLAIRDCPVSSRPAILPGVELHRS